MIYIESVKLINRSYPGTNALKKGFEFDCKSVNLFTGNQGCGKSTMLNLIMKSHEDLSIRLSDFTLSNGVDSLFFDAEKDNPRMKDLQTLEKTYGYGRGLASHFKSHGEVLEELVIDMLFQVKNKVIVLDEPESGLSITNQFKLIKGINTAVENNCQLFIATHCFPLIQAFDVISLEHNKIMKGIDFITKVSKIK